ncbi:MAG: serine/threonine protein kinase [Sandaracinus sp.]|nr:serine/threonine protein kinase [Sandaracinus sp.]MCB9613979.1 serine/threonine protein kinase [Sandaracinus sp.]MCB9620427.1 serine/threonine protein kinase [Sandaracinus sp.]MCB9624525.1 serine/threonine protein kinase [Sandaracinus sp.]
MRGWVSAIVVFAATGCGAGDLRELTSWELRVDGHAARAVELPARLDVDESTSRYVLETTIDVPAEALELILPAPPAPASVRADGLPALPRHEVTQGLRAFSAQRFVLPEEATRDGRVRLEVEVTNGWSQASWWTVTPSLAPQGTVDPRLRRAEWVNDDAAAVSFAALVQIGLVCLGVFLLDRKRVAYLLFAIQVLTAAVYPLYAVGWLQAKLGVAEVPVLAVGLLVAATVSVFFTHVFFGLRPAWRGWIVLCVVGVVVVVATSDPFLCTDVAGPTVVLLVGAIALYQIVTCVRLFVGSADRLAPGLLLVAWLSLAGTAWLDFLYWVRGPDLTEGARPAVIGLALFATYMALILARRHLQSLADGDRLNAELAGRVDELERHAAEIEALNAELRRQIGERSNQIVAALSLSRDDSVRAPRLEVGDVVQDRYRVMGLLGTGGMGSVYEVERVGDEKRFALKLTHDLDATALARLAREAHIAASIRNPHVVGVIDVDVSSHGFLFVVMELVRGTTLRDRRAQYGDPVWATPVLAQVADGLAALHAGGIVHRDLKPANVLLTGSAIAPTARIADFGVSRLESSPGDLSARPAPAVVQGLGEDEATITVADRPPTPDTDSQRRSAIELRRNLHLTRTGDVAGTPLYMAPESLSGQVAPPGDVFAFGVIAYELLTGRRPFDESLALALLEGRDLPPPEPLSSFARDVDPELASLVIRCLDRESSRRPSARELADRFGRKEPRRAEGE